MEKRIVVRRLQLDDITQDSALLSDAYYAEDGWYDSSTGEAELMRRALLYNSTQQIDADYIKYNKELNTPGVDQNIYIDTDSVFFSAAPLMNVRYPDWKNENNVVQAGTGKRGIDSQRRQKG